MTALCNEIKLDAHRNGFFKTMNEFRKKNLFCDVTLDTGGTLFPCHRFVLSASSSYFRIMFNGNFRESNSNVIPIQDVSAEIMEIILSAVYSSEINLRPEKVYFILKASHLLQVDMIFNVCVECIITNSTHIHYLIETCLFAETFGLKNVFDECVRGIAADFVHWGKTDSFLNLPFDIVKLIFSHVDPASNTDEVVAIMSKWCRSHPIHSSDIKKLIQGSKFSGRSIETPVMGQLIFASMLNTIEGLIGKDDKNINEDWRNEDQLNGDFKFNLHLNAVDVKTGARGWATLKLSESFDDCTLSNFRIGDHSLRKICPIGTKIFCLEWNFLARKFIFYCYEDDRRTELPLPEELTLVDSDTDGLPWGHTHFETIAIDKVIYLFYRNIDSEIWVYDCELNIWQNNTFKPPENDYFGFTRPALIHHGDWFTVTSLDRVLYVVGCKRVSCEDRYILSIDIRNPTVKNYITFPNPFQHKNAAVCAFDRQIAFSGSNHCNTLHKNFSIFDMTANRWRTDLMPMNEGRARHKLLHHHGFIYALESQTRPFIKNEKYDVKSNLWIDVPNLPEQAQFVDADDINKTVSFKNLLYANISSAVALYN